MENKQKILDDLLLREANIKQEKEQFITSLTNENLVIVDNKIKVNKVVLCIEYNIGEVYTYTGELGILSSSLRNCERATEKTCLLLKEFIDRTTNDDDFNPPFLSDENDVRYSNIDAIFSVCGDFLSKKQIESMEVIKEFDLNDKDGYIYEIKKSYCNGEDTELLTDSHIRICKRTLSFIEEHGFSETNEQYDEDLSYEKYLK